MGTHLGHLLSHYRLDEQIGAGGMGVVYRARNLNLDTDVALKVLPDRTLTDSDARHQFSREAQCLSHLAHPHIAMVHDFDTADGVDFLVMEYVPGVTLHDKLRDGPLAMAEVLRLGLQLVEGLEYAHARGIIHRDIKPGNLRLTPEGNLKILDFGLAKLFRSGESSPTVSVSDGRVGTIQYMAPEQFEGRADERSDIYGAGAVLYEMTTARRPYPHDVLHDTLQTPRSLNRNTSYDLERIILKALDRDPERRYQTMREMRVDLVRSLEPSSNTGATHGNGRRRWRRRRFWGVVCLLVTITVAVAIFLRFRTDDLELMNPRLIPVATSYSLWAETRLSPDARWVSYIVTQGEKEELRIRHTQGGEPQTILSLQDNILSHVWSPDGERIALLILQSSGVLLQIIPSFGGAPQTSISLDAPFENATIDRWILDNIYIDVSKSGLWRYDTATEKWARVFDSTGPNGVLRRHFDICQDEHCAIFEVAGDRQRIGMQELTDKRPLLLTTAEASSIRPRWMGPGCRSMVFSSDRSGQMDLWGMSVGKRELRQITFSTYTEHVLDTSTDGTHILFEQLEERASLWMLHPESHTERQRLTQETALDHWPSVSRDGTLLAFQRQESMLQNSDYYAAGIMLAELHGDELSNQRRVVRVGGAALLSPDGRWLAFARPAPGGYELCLLDPHSGHTWRAEQRFQPNTAWPFPQDWLGPNLAWSPDGAALYFVARSADGESEIRRLVVAVGASASELIVTSPDTLVYGDLHPVADGQWLCYARVPRRPSTTHEICCLDLATRSQRRLVSWQFDRSGDLRLRGQHRSGNLLVLRGFPAKDYTQLVEILDVSMNGSARVVGTIDRAFVATARLDTRRDRLYVTRSDATGVHNLFAFDLETQTLQALTDNTLQDVSFSGPAILPDGGLLFSQQEGGFSTWLIRFEKAE